MNQHLIIAPNLKFQVLAAQLTSKGWQRVPDPTAPPPILPGEPDLAAWTLPGSDSRIVYTFHPAMFLRVLSFEGEQAAQHRDTMAQRLPILGPDDLRRLLRSDKIESILLGIHGADALGAAELIDQIAPLTDNSDELIARSARHVLQKLLAQMVAGGIGILRKLQPDRAPLATIFPFLGTARQRRQLLRWLIHDQSQANPNIDAILSAALEDPDWEVRVTGMLAAARLKAVSARPFIARARLPERKEEGVDAMDRRILKALRDAAIRLLEGEPVPPLSDAPLATRPAMQAHIMRCAAGLPTAWHERVFLLAISLTQPFDDSTDLVPSRLPSGVIVQEHGYALGDLALAWIPPVGHWLGDELEHAPVSNPIRQATPDTGFFIARDLISQDGAPLMVTWEQARQFCDDLAQRYGTVMRLPTADEWEMAARGTDGRRFPWGNTLDREGDDVMSPWKLRSIVGVASQWTSTLIANRPIRCGGPDQLRCSLRIDMADVGYKAAVRPVVASPSRSPTTGTR